MNTTVFMGELRPLIEDPATPVDAGAHSRARAGKTSHYFFVQWSTIKVILMVCSAFDFTTDTSHH